MSESSYIDMANKIAMMLNNKIDETTTKEEIANVSDTLTELIHMENVEQNTQEGGMTIETLMDNMTGGNNNATSTKETIYNITSKNINDNYFEGGGKTESGENSEEEDFNNIGEDDNEEESEEDFNDSEDDGLDQSYSSVNFYEEFLKHYNDREINNMYENVNMTGGNKQEDKIKIISRFPYMVRY